MEVALINPNVTIKPTIPGCNVVPNELKTNFDEAEDTITFYITPEVKGDIQGKIEFLNEGDIIHTEDFKGKVVDPRFARVIAIYGIVGSFVPKILSVLGFNLGLNYTLYQLWAISTDTFGGLSIASLIGLAGILPVVAISLLVRQKLQPKSNKTQFKLKDFRFKKVQP